MVVPQVLASAAVAYAGYKYLKESRSDDNSESSKDTNTNGQSDAKESSIAHNEAKKRAPPVETGEIYRILLEERVPHESPRTFKGRYQGFWVFVTVRPDDVGTDDVVNAKVTDISDKGNAAQAKFVSSA